MMTSGRGHPFLRVATSSEISLATGIRHASDIKK
jgi:hypothetical protein